jgi:hypothetical protein
VSTYTEAHVYAEINSKLYPFRAKQLTNGDPDAYYLAVAGHMVLRDQVPAALAVLNTPPAEAKSATPTTLWQELVAALTGTVIPTLPPALQSLLTILLTLLPSV